jgi:hypothetical protein
MYMQIREVTKPTTPQQQRVAKQARINQQRQKLNQM